MVVRARAGRPLLYSRYSASFRAATYGTLSREKTNRRSARPTRMQGTSAEASPRGGLSVFGLLKKASSGVTSGVRHLVSKKKRRFLKDGFDLDLSYTTPQLIAMGYPCTGTEIVYRNPATQVSAFIAKYHHDTCKVYNLCIERTYPASLVGLTDGLVENHGTFDHNAMPLFSLLPLMRSIALWLDRSPAHVAAIHCKAGKGRTGMVICAYLVWSGECATAAEALHLFGVRRTTNGKGVTIPSQRRYVEYAQRLRELAGGGAAAELPTLRTVELRGAVHNAGAAAATAAIDITDAVGGGAAAAAAAAPSSSSSSSSSTPSRGLMALPLLQLPPLLRIDRVVLLDAPDAATQPGTYFTVELVHRQDGGAGPPPAPTESPSWRMWRVYDHRTTQAVQQVGSMSDATDGGTPRKGKGGSMMRRASLSLTRGGSVEASSARTGAGGAGDRSEGMICDPRRGLPAIAGDVKIVVHLANGKKLAQLWFHTAFVGDGGGGNVATLDVRKSELDKARKNKSLPASFRVRVVFAQKLGTADETSERAKLENSARMSTNNLGPALTQQDEGDEDEDDDEEEDEEEGDGVDSARAALASTRF